MSELIEKLIEGLNEDLAHEYAAILMYNHYAANVRGIYGQIFKQLFLEELQDEIKHAQFLAKKIVTLGGIPTLTTKEIKHTTDHKEMLENILQAEKDTLERYLNRMRQAEEAGQLALKIELETLYVDETKHMEEITKLLQN